MLFTSAASELVRVTLPPGLSPRFRGGEVILRSGAFKHVEKVLQNAPPKTAHWAQTSAPAARCCAVSRGEKVRIRRPWAPPKACIYAFRLLRAFCVCCCET